jgi:hypothetical protein
MKKTKIRLSSGWTYKSWEQKEQIFKKESIEDGTLAQELLLMNEIMRG